MTVKELKKALENVPDDVEVRALKDGAYCEKTDVWWATYNVDEDQDEYEYEYDNKNEGVDENQTSQAHSLGEFTINC